MCLTVSARSRLMYLCPSSGVAPMAVVTKPTAVTGHFIIHHLEVSTIDLAIGRGFTGDAMWSGLYW